MDHRTDDPAPGPRPAAAGTTSAGPLAALPLGACSGPRSMLEPAGPGADSIAPLWWVLLAIMSGLLLAVLGALGWAPFHRPRTADASEPAERRRVFAVLAAGAGVPAPILTAIFAQTLSVLDDIGPSLDDPVEVMVTIIGRT